MFSKLLKTVEINSKETPILVIKLFFQQYLSKNAKSSMYKAIDGNCALYEYMHIGFGSCFIFIHYTFASTTKLVRNILITFLISIYFILVRIQKRIFYGIPGKSKYGFRTIWKRLFTLRMENNLYGRTDVLYTA